MRIARISGTFRWSGVAAFSPCGARSIGCLGREWFAASSRADLRADPWCVGRRLALVVRTIRGAVRDRVEALLADRPVAGFKAGAEGAA